MIIAGNTETAWVMIVCMFMSAVLIFSLYDSYRNSEYKYEKGRADALKNNVEKLHHEVVDLKCRLRDLEAK